MNAYHTPIMLREIIGALEVTKDKLYFDGTLGGGGHSLEILKAGGRLVATDLDGDAITHSSKRFDESGYAGRYTLVRGNFKDFLESGDNYFDGAVLDLGISSHQVDEPKRGFSYRYDSPLDMRMDDRQKLTAFEIVNSYPEKDLLKILYEYGEERFARRIVGNIISERRLNPIKTTNQLAELITRSVPHIKGGHPAKKTFQALRIEVNGELERLAAAIERLVSRMNSGARICILTFHSLEDRIVKQTFKTLATNCICNANMPICVCNHKAEIKIFATKQKPTKEELEKNSRSKSATLRIAEKL